MRDLDIIQYCIKLPVLIIFVQILTIHDKIFNNNYTGLKCYWDEFQGGVY